MNKDSILSTDDELTTDDEFEYVKEDQLADIIKLNQPHNGPNIPKPLKNQLDESPTFFDR